MTSQLPKIGKINQPENLYQTSASITSSKLLSSPTTTSSTSQVWVSIFISQRHIIHVSQLYQFGSNKHRQHFAPRLMTIKHSVAENGDCNGCSGGCAEERSVPSVAWFVGNNGSGSAASQKRKYLSRPCAPSQREAATLQLNLQTWFEPAHFVPRKLPEIWETLHNI